MDWNDDDGAGDDAEDDEEYSDDDDMSWKVRRAAAKCLEAIVVTDCTCLSTFMAKVAPRLIARYKRVTQRLVINPKQTAQYYR
jgi:cullin-associated NEDD8-dissociated protein 1